MEKLIELEYGFMMNSANKEIYNAKMETVSETEYETLIKNKRKYVESYFPSSEQELDMFDREGRLLQVFSNETEDGGTAYYVVEPDEITHGDTYQFYREIISFGKASRVDYREIDSNELIQKYKKFRSEEEYVALQKRFLNLYQITRDDISESPLKEYMGHLYKHLKVIYNDELVTLKFNSEEDLTGIEIKPLTVKRKGFSRGR